MKEHQGKERGTMEKTIFFTKELVYEGETFTLEYALLCSPSQSGSVYGVSVKKQTEENQMEEDWVEGLTQKKETAEVFLKKLSDGFAFPVELVALCDDFLYEEAAS